MIILKNYANNYIIKIMQKFSVMAWIAINFYCIILKIFVILQQVFKI